LQADLPDGRDLPHRPASIPGCRTGPPAFRAAAPARQHSGLPHPAAQPAARTASDHALRRRIIAFATLGVAIFIISIDFIGK